VVIVFLLWTKLYNIKKITIKSLFILGKNVTYIIEDSDQGKPNEMSTQGISGIFTYFSRLIMGNFYDLCVIFPI